MYAGIRAVLVATGKVKNYHVPLGPGTNQLAELLAVEEALSRVVLQREKANVTVYSDSTYAIGCLDGSFKNVKKNADTARRIKSLMTEFKSVKFVKVKGHSGNIGNEAADRLAKGKTDPRRT